MNSGQHICTIDHSASTLWKLNDQHQFDGLEVEQMIVAVKMFHKTAAVSLRASSSHSQQNVRAGKSKATKATFAFGMSDILYGSFPFVLSKVTQYAPCRSLGISLADTESTQDYVPTPAIILPLPATLRPCVVRISCLWLVGAAWQQYNEIVTIKVAMWDICLLFRIFNFTASHQLSLSLSLVETGNNIHCKITLKTASLSFVILPYEIFYFWQRGSNFVQAGNYSPSRAHSRCEA